ncbi:MAG: aldolase [Acetobacteraceae bacterium]|nr:aldolase [Acetobacteraceae bacterium]
MHMHGSCAARAGAGVLIVGPPGSGKSDLLLRLLDRGFRLVADDRVGIDGLAAAAPPALSGLLEVRGLGIMRLPYLPSCTLALVAALGGSTERLPSPERHPDLDLPLIRIDAACPSAAQRVELALDAVLGRIENTVGAFRA